VAWISTARASAGGRGEQAVEFGDGRVVERIALLRPVDADDQHGAVPLDFQHVGARRVRHRFPLIAE
jgi:hypothetical protein